MEQLIEVVGFGLFFIGEIALIVFGMMKTLGYEPEPRPPRPKVPVARASLRQVIQSLREFEDHTKRRKD